MKNILPSFLFIFLLISITSSAQETKKSIFNNAYVAAELNFRNYGTDDQNGFGFGGEISKDFKKWLGAGVNVSYWNHSRISWDFHDPFTMEHYQYYTKITDFKVSPFIQLIPLNTRHFDIIARVGLRTGYFNQKLWLGGYNTDYYNQVFDIFIYDAGYKGVNLGYEYGFSLRFQFNKLIIVPSILQSQDNHDNSFSSLNLRIGWQLP